MANLFALLQAGTVGGCELAVLPARWNLEKEDIALLSLDFSNASSTVNRTFIVDICAKLFPEALPLILAVYATLHKRSRPVRIAPRPLHLVEGRIPQHDRLGPNLTGSALQFVLVTRYSHMLSLEHPVAVRAYLDDVSVAGSPLGISAPLADVTALAAEMNLELNTRQCAWWTAFDLIPPTHHLPSYLCVVLKL